MNAAWKLSLLVVLLLPVFASAVMPSWRYRVLVSENFEIIFREDQTALAKRYLLAAEQAHELLFPIFKEGPTKTYVVLRDDTDLANGLADFLPYPHIVIFPVLPTAADSIDEFGDWPLEMMIHEYAHILNIYPAHGIYWPFKYILGSVVRPNGVLPRWYLEGLAVNLETRLTEFGRLRSPDTQAVARAMVLGAKFASEDIATVNESDIKTFPYGARPYLYGGWWWDQLHRHKDDEAIYTLNQNFSRRLPFLLNGPIREQSGLNTEGVLRAALESQTSLAQRQIAAIREAKPQDSKDVFSGSGDVLAFAISPSGLKIVYWLGLIDKGSFAFVRTRENPNQPFKEAQEKKLFRTVGTTRVSWLNDDEFVFDQIDAVKPHVNYRDLYRYNLTTRYKQRLTDGARAQDPAVSPNGLGVAFIQNDGGRTRLAYFDLNKKSIRTLVGGSLRVRLSAPEFLNDKEVLFIVRAMTGDEKIYVFDFASKKSRVWSEALTSAQTLRRTPAGILTTDAGTGARNAYRFSAAKPNAVTNTFTSILTADYDPHSRALVFNELTADGPRLKMAPLKAEQPPKIPRPEFDPPIKAGTEKVKFKEVGFWPISYLAPRYIIPTIYTVEDGVIVQGLTSGKDPLARNSYDLFGAYDSVTNKASYGLSYLNSSLPADIGLSYGKYVSYLGASGRLIESQDAGLRLQGPIGSRLRTWALNGAWSETEGGAASYRRLGPGAAVAYNGISSPYKDRVGVHVEIRHQEFLAQSGYLAYGRTYAHLASSISFGHHKLGLQARGALASNMPFEDVVVLGDRNVGGNYLISLANSEFLMRGYPSGTFVGRKIINGNLEWAFPATELTRGFGTFPVFLRDVEFAIFADAIAVDGRAYSSLYRGYAPSGLGEFYMGTGGEMRLMTTMAYHVPVSLTLGLYYGFKDEYGGGLGPFFAVGLGSLSPIAKKTP